MKKQLIQTFKTTGLFLMTSFAIMSCNSGNNSEGNAGPASDSVATAKTTSTEPAPIEATCSSRY